MTPRVYVSVSGAFADVAGDFCRDVAAPGLGLDESDFFVYRSAQGTNLPLFADPRRAMADRARTAEAFVFLIDPAWKASAFCYMELGAAWMRSNLDNRPTDEDLVVILVGGGVDPADIRPPEFPSLQVGRIDRPNDVLAATRALGRILRCDVAEVAPELAAAFTGHLSTEPVEETPELVRKPAIQHGLITPHVERVDHDQANLVLSNGGAIPLSDVSVEVLDMTGCDLGGHGMPAIPPTFAPGDRCEVAVFRNAQTGRVFLRIAATLPDGHRSFFEPQVPIVFG